MWHLEEQKVLCRPKELAASLEATLEHLHLEEKFESFTCKIVTGKHLTSTRTQRIRNRTSRIRPGSFSLQAKSRNKSSALLVDFAGVRAGPAVPGSHLETLVLFACNENEPRRIS